MWTQALPRREGATLQISTDVESLLYVGGRDETGVEHDDAWKLPLVSSTVREAKRALPDSGQASNQGFFYALSSDGSVGTRINLEASAPAGYVVWDRRPTGWVPQPVANTQCSAQTGSICSFANDWWASPGVMTCAGSCSSSPSAREQAFAFSQSVISYAFDADAVWLLHAGDVEAWTLPEAGSSPRLLGRTSVHGALSMAVANGRAVVGTSAGAVLVRRTPNGLAAGATLSTCGRALAVSALTGDLFAIATSVGMTTVAVDDVTLRRVKGWRYDLRDGSISLTALGDSAPSALACQLIEVGLSSLQWPANAQLLTVSADRALLARGPMLLDIDGLSTATPAINSWATASMPISALRLESPTRAYAAGKLPGVRSGWRIELGQHLQLEHVDAAAPWALRHDKGRLSARIVEPARSLELAWVAR